jgi:hypothetical protein
MIEFPIAPYTKYKGVECLMNISTGGCNVTPHVARKSRYSAIDGRTTRHAGYAQSQRRRKLVEERFGWMKDIGGLRKLKHRGLAKVGWIFKFVAAACKVVMMRRLLAET